MSDTMEIIISAVDSASEVFQSIIESATSMASGITDAVGDAGSDFDTIADNVANFSDAVANVDTSTLEEVADQLGMDTDEVERLLSSAADIGSMSAGFNEVAAAADELEQELQEDVDKMEELGSAGDVMAAQTFMDFAKGASDTMSEMADKAGSVQDSWTRLGLAADGAGISMDNMKSAVSGLSDETGRAGGSIRESFIAMTSAGITDMNAMQTVFKGASAQAFILGTDVNSLADKFSGMAMKSTLSEKTLKGTGITMAELGEAMGLHGATVDEVKDKWSELDTNQRAAALGMAASMNEGKDANEEYKNSWQGLQDQVQIAKGKLETMAGKVLLPVLVPAMKLASDILSGFGSVIDSVMNGPFGGLVSIVGASAGVFMIAFAGVLALKNILGFLKLEASLAKIEMLALTFAEEFQATGSITSAAANMIGATGFSGLATAAWGAATAVWAAIAPLLPFIAAAALVAIAIYEVGKAFGWWHDLGSMFDAIKDGAMRMWDAFINHPDVQATIQAIIDVWNWLVPAVQEAGQAIMDFFGINEQGNFDVVRTLIDAIGQAWQAISLPLRTVIGMVQQVIAVFDQFRTGQIDLPTLITTILTMLGEAYNNMFLTIIGLVVNFGMQILQRAVTAATNFVRAIVTRIMQLPGRIRAYLFQVAMHVLTMGQQWVVNARLKALALVTAVVTGISSLPGHMLNTLSSAVSAITSAGQQWITEAKNKAGEIVSGIRDKLSGVSGAISGALSGVASAITAPFRAAWDTLKPIVDKIREAMKIIPGGGQGGMDLDVSKQINIADPGKYYTPVYEGSSNNSNDVNINFTGLPSTMSERQLVNLLTSKGVINALVNSNDFQSANRKATARYNSKIARSG